MDRLNDISRSTGYPWCAEEIEILESHADYLNGLLDGLGLPQGSCVFLHYPARIPFSGELLTYIVPASEGLLNLAPRGELFMLKINDNVDITTLLNGASSYRNITIAEQSHHVYGTQAGEWLDCYKTRIATLSEGSAYKFYYLNDLLRPAVWMDLTGYLGDVVETPLISPPTITGLYRVQNYPYRFRKSSQEIELDLLYSIGYGNIIGSVTDCVIQQFRGYPNLGIDDNIERPLNGVLQSAATVLQEGSFSPVLCSIANNGIYIRGLSGASGYVRIWGRVSLK